MNRAADSWLAAQAEARAFADEMELGALLRYEDAEALGEKTMAELRKCLRAQGRMLQDEGGDGYRLVLSGGDL